MEFFRHCPGCGRRFHVKLEDVKMVRDEKRKIPTKRVAVSTLGGTTTRGLGSYSRHIPPAPGPMLYEGKPVILEEKDFQYTYKCGHCGHEWTEHHEKIHRER